MNKQELYEWILKIPRSKGVNPRYVIRDRKPRIFQRLCDILSNRFTMRDLFDYLRPNEPKTCISCGAPTRFQRFYRGYAKWCGPQCSNDHELVKQRKIEPCRANLGVDNPSQSEKIKRKKIRTCRRNRGTDYPQQDLNVRKKSVKVLLERYGVDAPAKNPEILKRIRETTFERYGVENPSYSSELLEKKRQTYLKNWGANSHMQNKEFYWEFLKDLHRTKHVVFRGREFYLQGYEPQALKFMVKKLGIPLSNISEVPASIKYRDPDKKKTRTYYPDFIVGDNLCVEVKSRYTAGMHLENGVSNELIFKYRGCRKQGKDFLLLVLDGQGNLEGFALNDLLKYGIRKADQTTVKTRILATLFPLA